MLFVRNIKKELANKCVANPDQILIGEGSKKIYLKDFGVNYLKLIVSEENKNKVIITVHWVAKKRFKQ